MVKKTKTKAKKKPRKQSDSSGGYNLSDIIQSPPSTGEWNLFEGVFSDLIFQDSLPYLIHLTCVEYYYMLSAGSTETDNPCLRDATENGVCCG